MADYNIELLCSIAGCCIMCVTTLIALIFHYHKKREYCYSSVDGVVWEQASFTEVIFGSGTKFIMQTNFQPQESMK